MRVFPNHTSYNEHAWIGNTVRVHEMRDMYQSRKVLILIERVACEGFGQAENDGRTWNESETLTPDPAVCLLAKR